MNPNFSDELISAYLDGELTSAEQAVIEQLLVDNAAARQMFEELRTLRAGLQGLPQSRLDDNFAARVLRTAEREMLKASPSAPAKGAPTSVSDVTRLLRRWQRRFWVMATVAAGLLITLSLDYATHGWRGLANAPPAKANAAKANAAIAAPDFAATELAATELAAKSNFRESHDAFPPPAGIVPSAMEKLQFSLESAGGELPHAVVPGAPESSAAFSYANSTNEPRTEPPNAPNAPPNGVKLADNAADPSSRGGLADQDPAGLSLQRQAHFFGKATDSLANESSPTIHAATTLVQLDVDFDQQNLRRLGENLGDRLAIRGLDVTEIGKASVVDGRLESERLASNMLLFEGPRGEVVKALQELADGLQIESAQVWSEQLRSQYKRSTAKDLEFGELVLPSYEESPSFEEAKASSESLASSLADDRKALAGGGAAAPADAGKPSGGRTGAASLGVPNREAFGRTEAAIAGRKRGESNQQALGALAPTASGSVRRMVLFQVPLGVESRAPTPDLTVKSEARDAPTVRSRLAKDDHHDGLAEQGETVESNAPVRVIVMFRVVGAPPSGEKPGPAPATNSPLPEKP